MKSILLRCVYVLLVELRLRSGLVCKVEALEYMCSVGEAAQCECNVLVEQLEVHESVSELDVVESCVNLRDDSRGFDCVGKGGENCGLSGAGEPLFCTTAFRLFISYTSVYKQEKTETTAQIYTNFKLSSREKCEIFQNYADADIFVANLYYFEIDIAPYRMVRSDRKFEICLLFSNLEIHHFKSH